MPRPPKPLKAISASEAESNLAALHSRRLAVTEELSRTHDPDERQALLDFLGTYQSELKRAERQRSDAVGREYLASLRQKEKEDKKAAKEGKK